MQVNDFQDFHEGIVGVMAFYSKDVSRFSLDVWWNSLKAYDLKAIQEAFGRHVANPDAGQFPPKPADIIRMLQGSTQDSALSAWSKVDMAVRRVGSYADVVFDDPLIHRVLHDMGGWIALGSKTEDEWPFVAREFENRYRGFKARNEIPDYPAVLTGIANAHNIKEKFNAAPPVMVGNEEAAKKVMLGGTQKPMLGFKQMSADLEAAVGGIQLIEKRAA